MPRFFGTAAVCGPMVVAAVFAFSGFVYAAALLCLVSVASNIWKFRSERKLYVAGDQSHDRFDRRSLRLVNRHLLETLRMRSFCFVVATAMGVMSMILCPSVPAAGGMLAVGAALLMLTAENLERLLYFQSVVYDRMPGTL